MSLYNALPALCPVHGPPKSRHSCRQCNAAYMRGYMRTARRKRPGRAILDRARHRARKNGVSFALSGQDILVPQNCPVLGFPLVIGGPRSNASPSLDRINPRKGYAAGNVRVISDRANRLKGGHSLSEIEALSRKARPDQRADYKAIAIYMEREALLIDVKRKAQLGGSASPWMVIADFLEHKFRAFFD